MKFVDLMGQKFGRLFPIKYMGKNKWGNFLWLCECECGKETTVRYNNLNNGHTKSCGCLQRKHGYNKRKGVSPTYNSWRGIVQRCTNPNHKYYKDYGGRDKPITVCERWSNKKNGFENFLEDMGKKPNKKQLDRIDNSKGYYKSNCRWTTSKINNRNRRDNILITFNGETHLLIRWSEILGIQYSTLYYRIYIGKWSIKKALTTQINMGKINV